MLKKTTTLLIALVWAMTAYGQMETEAYSKLVKRERDTLSDYRPVLFGAVKAKYELSLYDGRQRFNVRNSRIGVQGLAARNIRYMSQIDFSNEGSITVLDAFVSYNRPTFAFTLGQQQTGFSTDLDRGPSSSIFSNRSFIVKYLTTYHRHGDGNATNDAAGAIGARELGFRFDYTPLMLPVSLNAGIYNGTGLNNPEWTNRVNFVGRLKFGKPLGFGAAFSHYNGYTPLRTDAFTTPTGEYIKESYDQKIVLWGGELRYAAQNFRIEGELAQRRLKTEGHLAKLTVAHILGYYQFRLDRGQVLEFIAPVGRWDFGDNVEFMNRDGSVEKFNANRATLGVNLGFAGRIIGAEIRLQFEKYFIDRKPSDFIRNPMLQDKMTIEFVAVF